eukprot:COSAG05_NODE_258_length_12741_cov_168.778279_9_plen_79_part_00
MVCRRSKAGGSKEPITARCRAGWLAGSEGHVPSVTWGAPPVASTENPQAGSLTGESGWLAAPAGWACGWLVSTGHPLI